MRILSVAFGLTAIICEPTVPAWYTLRIWPINIPAHHVLSTVIPFTRLAAARETCRADPTNLKRTESIHHKIQFGSFMYVYILSQPTDLFHSQCKQAKVRS